MQYIRQSKAKVKDWIQGSGLGNNYIQQVFKRAKDHPLQLIEKLNGQYCLIGHSPDLIDLAAKLLGSRTNCLILKKA